MITGAKCPPGKNFRAHTEDLQKALKAAMSPKGKLKLPKLLDQRRLEYGIPDGVFTTSAVFDRVLVYQIELNAEETYVPGGKLIRADVTRQRDMTETPLGVVVTAGLRALDALRSNGIDLGHVVRFARNVVWQMPMCSVGGPIHKLVVLRAGEIVSSEDLDRAMKAGKVKVKLQRSKSADGTQEYDTHVLVDEKGKAWNPQDPWISDDN